MATMRLNKAQKDHTDIMLQKFHGAWEGNETTTELMKTIKENITSRYSIRLG